MTHKIPTIVESFSEGSAPPAIDISQGLTYEPSKGESVDVLLWVRYPAYDFIFGVPAASSPMYEKEIGFYQFRDTRAKRVHVGFYVDIEETEELINGFQKILERSKEHSKHLWEIQTKK